jgi:CDI immunity proteins
MFDSTKSIEQLENDYWPTAISNPTKLTEKCYHYRRIPVQELTTEQTRLLIGQNIGLHFLIPKAIDILRSNILAEGDFFEGDLLNAVLNCDINYWEVHADLRSEVIDLIKQNRSEIEEKNESNSFRQLLKDIDLFLK